jgi:hypothetical protein
MFPRRAWTSDVVWRSAALKFCRERRRHGVFGFMPVVPMVIVSALLMIVVSLATQKPRDDVGEVFWRSQS